MTILRKNNSETNITLTISATAEEITTAKSKALAKLAPNVKLPGFRPGHVPINLVEKNLDPNLLQEETLNNALNILYTSALNKEDIRPVDQPKVDIKKFVPYTTLEFTADVDVLGAIILPDYKKLDIKKTAVKVEKKDVDEVIGRLQLQIAEYKEETRAAKTEDRVWIDFAGKDKDGNEVAGAKGEDYPLALGSNTFIPGFEENLLGAVKDDVKEFTIPFPKEYGVKALQGKKVTFTVTVKKVESTVLPKIDAEFAKQVGNFLSVEDLKKDIEKQIKLEREHQADNDYQDALIKKIVEGAKITLPQSLIDEQVELVDREFKQNLLYRGQTFKEYLESAGLTEEEYKAKELTPVAEERLKAGLILSEIAEQEKITITPEELEIRIQVLKGRYQSDKTMQDGLDKPEARRETASRLLSEKTINKIVSYNK